jgi:hypothetical protein
MQFETFFVDLIDLCESRSEHKERVRDSSSLLTLDVKAIHFTSFFTVEQSEIEIESNEIRS